MTPIYYTFRGWPQLKGNYHSRLELPVELRLFLSFIEEHTNKKIRYISYGADRDKTIICH
ncbi:adenylosuccinate synthetase [Providencia sp. wls1948]|uniref:adenylosuccinate synthetase n=1 Tax=Providencia sp. wls1948 TaxID=2675149 RepID=UPI00300FACCF